MSKLVSILQPVNLLFC